MAGQMGPVKRKKGETTTQTKLVDIDPRILDVLDQVWLIGHSAGSHLCATLLSSPWYDGLPVAARKVNSNNYNH